MDKKYVTITGVNFYYGREVFRIGKKFYCRKDYFNSYDTEAIEVLDRALGTVGYIANSVSTTVPGTMSAGRIYDRVGETFLIRVMFMTHTKIICEVIKNNVSFNNKNFRKDTKVKGTKYANKVNANDEFDFDDLF